MKGQKDLLGGCLGPRSGRITIPTSRSVAIGDKRSRDRAGRAMSGRQIMDDLELLLGVMPPQVRKAIEAGPDGEALIEIVLDLGRPPEARFAERGVELSGELVTRQDIAWV